MASLVVQRMKIHQLVKTFREVKKIRDLDLQSVMSDKSDPVLQNRKIFCVTYVRNEQDKRALQEQVASWLDQLEKKAASVLKYGSKISLDAKILSDSIKIVGSIDAYLDDLQDGEIVAISKTQDGTLQAVGTIEMEWDSYRIKLFATAPHNLKIFSEDGDRMRIHGAGTSIIHHLLRTSLLHGAQRIVVNSAKRAMSFYHLLGFTGAHNIYNCGPMYLSLGAVQERANLSYKKILLENVSVE